MDKITVIGLGLIGGSIAKAIKRIFPETYIVAVDKSDESCKAAFAENVANEVYTYFSDKCLESITGSNIIFLCTGFETCRNIIERLIPCIEGGNTIITDVCSTKTGIKNVFQNIDKNIAYIGGHPMAGSEKSGYKVSSPYLLENAIYILCPLEETREENLEFLRKIILNIGALPYIMNAEEHDEAMARISHLPHIMASALVNSASEYKDDGILRTLAAGGFKDITRIASGDPDLWKNIILANKENIIKSIDSLTDMLGKFRSFAVNSDTENIYEFLECARTSREGYETGRKTIMNLMYELSVDVPDKPGIIAEISAKLLENNINIRNIYIAESRDNELGCMRLAFDSKDARDRAALILEVNN